MLIFNLYLFSLFLLRDIFNFQLIHVASLYMKVIKTLYYLLQIFFSLSFLCFLTLH